MDTSIPPKSRKEWREMVSGELEYSYANYFLQVTLHKLRKDIENNVKTQDQAINDLHYLCSKYNLAIKHDLKQIFKSW